MPHCNAGSALGRLVLGGGAELEVEELPPELKVAFAEGDEGGQQHHRIWCEVVRLDLVESEEGAEEAARRQAEAAKKVRPADDVFAVLRHR